MFEWVSAQCQDGLVRLSFDHENDDEDAYFATCDALLDELAQSLGHHLRGAAR